MGTRQSALRPSALRIPSRPEKAKGLTEGNSALGGPGERPRGEPSANTRRACQGRGRHRPSPRREGSLGPAGQSLGVVGLPPFLRKEHRPDRTEMSLGTSIWPEGSHLLLLPGPQATHSQNNQACLTHFFPQPLPGHLSPLPGPRLNGPGATSSMGGQSTGRGKLQLLEASDIWKAEGGLSS